MAKVQFRVPATLTCESMFGIINALIKDGAPISSEITLDFAVLRFVDSAGVAFLSNLVEWLVARGAEVNYCNADHRWPGCRYLDDVGFFETYWRRPLHKFAAVRSTTYPFKRLTCAESHQWLDGNVFPWIADKINIPQSSLREFQTCVRELFQNIEDHSTEQIGCMHVQWHPKIDVVKIAISDFGIGIPTEVRKVAPVRNDAVAIATAIQEGFSSKKGGKNRGAGLPYLVDNVVTRNRGVLDIYSGNGHLAFNGQTPARAAHLTDGQYPGTLVSMALRSDTISVEEDDSEDTLW